METSIMPREQYHERMLDLIAENLKQQGYTKEALKQYNLDRDKGMSEADAMERLHRLRAKEVLDKDGGSVVVFR